VRYNQVFKAKRYLEKGPHAIKRIPPSQKIRYHIDELLNQGLEGEEDVTTVISRLGVERLLQEMLEQEVTDYLGREHYQRQQVEQEHRGYRNGYEPGRMAVEMYAWGLSPRDIEDALQEATGDRLLSHTTVSQLTDVLWEEYEAFAERDLSGFEVEYLFLHAVYESLRQQGGGQEGVLCAWGIDTDGRKVMLHLALGNKESYENWLDFLRDMIGRGLQTPVLITVDGAPGLMRAVEEVFPNSLRQRCLAHKIRNVIDRVPLNNQAEVKAPDVLKTYHALCPSAMKSFRDDWQACIAYLRCPRIHHKPIRTTNLLERCFLEERRRTKVILRFFTEKSCLKLVFATIWRASRRWQGVRMSEFERQQLKLLRRELGPGTDHLDTFQAKARSVAA
jgi:putative transposase